MYLVVVQVGEVKLRKSVKYFSIPGIARVRGTETEADIDLMTASLLEEQFVTSFYSLDEKTLGKGTHQEIKINFPMIAGMLKVQCSNGNLN